MVTITKPISKEIYERSVNHHLAGGDYKKVFTDAEVMGYGIYGTYCYEQDGKYFIRYERGESCD